VIGPLPSPVATTSSSASTSGSLRRMICCTTVPAGSQVPGVPVSVAPVSALAGPKLGSASPTIAGAGRRTGPSSTITGVPPCGVRRSDRTPPSIASRTASDAAVAPSIGAPSSRHW
jgi:hypothetical protein